MAVGPPPSVVGSERSAIWQLWHPALEATLDGHFSQDSSIAKIAGALNSLIDKMREGCFQVSFIHIHTCISIPRPANKCKLTPDPSKKPWLPRSQETTV